MDQESNVMSDHYSVDEEIEILEKANRILRKYHIMSIHILMLIDDLKKGDLPV